jgi:hypothetical protein
VTYDDLELRADEFDAPSILLVGLFDTHAAWDCNPDAEVTAEPYDGDLDLEDDTGDWQVLVLDRFGDRSVEPGLYTHRNDFAERQAELAELAREQERFTAAYL